jgi:hypothetical protein
MIKLPIPSVSILAATLMLAAAVAQAQGNPQSPQGQQPQDDVRGRMEARRQQMLQARPQSPANSPVATPSTAGVPSTLPATAPTTLPAANNALSAGMAAAPNTVASAPTTPPHHADVTYAAGLLNVRADNSSLNQILRTISRLTGMKITGGVADERVYGNYGPATPPTILATLLDGTGSNMLMRESSATGTPTELVLTPRGGGATPPSPDSSVYAEEPPAPPPPVQSASPAASQAQATQSGGPVPAGNNGPVSGPQPIPQPMNNVNGSPTNTDATASSMPTTNSVPLDTVATPSTTPSTAGIVDAPNPPPPGSTTSPNPGNVATPEQIYQQLKALQQAQQQKPAATPQ